MANAPQAAAATQAASRLQDQEARRLVELQGLLTHDNDALQQGSLCLPVWCCGREHCSQRHPATAHAFCIQDMHLHCLLHLLSLLLTHLQCCCTDSRAVCGCALVMEAGDPRP